MHTNATDGLMTIGELSRRRAVGRWGTVARVLVGSGLIVLAIAYWRAGWLELAIGLGALPAVATLLMSLRSRSAPPLRLGAAGHLVALDREPGLTPPTAST